MKRPPVLRVVIVLNVVVLVALAFAYPHLMVSPGALVAGHAELAQDCFACHAPWRGAASERCTDCHTPIDIGLRTTRGVPLATRGAVKASFHQDLVEQDCMACHSDHQGPRLTQRSRKPFSHELLKAGVRDACSSCHAGPKDRFHPDLKLECGQCHTTRAWAPAQFDHALLAPAALDRCETCHDAPDDRLHRQVRGGCKACHRTEAWKPASFDHDKSFVLDRDHDATCVTCHTGNDFKRYTCYGCHEHTPQNIRAEHLEEGIRDFDNCVECHRSADEEPRGRGERDRRERD